MTVTPDWIRHTETGAGLGKVPYQANSKHEMDYALCRSARAIIAFPDSSAGERAQADTTVTGSDDTAVLLAALANGGKTLMASGTGHITGNLTVPSDACLEGQGASTLLELDFNGHMFINGAAGTHRRRINLKNFRVDGNDRNYYCVYFDEYEADYGIDCDHLFENLYIENCNGIYHYANLGACQLVGIRVFGGQGDAIRLASPDNWLFRCEVGKRSYHTNTPTHGYKIDTSKCWILGCSAFKCGVGLYLYGEGYMVDNLVVDLCDAEAVKLLGVVDSTISHLQLRGNSTQGNYPDLKLMREPVALVDCQGNSITDSVFKGTPGQTSYNIEEDANCDYNTYMGNKYRNAVTASTLFYGGSNVNEHNQTLTGG